MTKAIEFILKIIAWLSIVASPFIFGMMAGGIIYLYFQKSKFGLVVAVFVVLLALILGIILATKIWKTKGTINFIARIRATPELDNFDAQEFSKTEHKNEKK